MIPKKKICSGRGKYEGLGCGTEQYIFSNGLCKGCIPVNSKPSRKKASGEGILFEIIWSERPHVSQVSGRRLVEDRNNPFFYHQFSHILSKGAYPKFRALKENIKLVLPEEHHDWEFRRYAIKESADWRWVFEKESELKERYHTKK